MVQDQFQFEVDLILQFIKPVILGYLSVKLLYVEVVLLLKLNFRDIKHFSRISCELRHCRQFIFGNDYLSNEKLMLALANLTLLTRVDISMIPCGW